MANDFRCKACGAEFENKEQLESHNRNSHPGGNPMGTPDSTR
jgi:hypothetical protein